jgi:hypothetical protein
VKKFSQKDACNPLISLDPDERKYTLDIDVKP